MEVDVAIVGAGAAGVGAARALADSGLSLVVLEASARVGGRAWTETFDGLALDLGCGWLHSGERNPWVGIAEAQGSAVSRSPAAWRGQWRDLGFSRTERAEAERAYEAWLQRMTAAPLASDCAADALEIGGRWNAWLEAISGFVNGAELAAVSIADFLAYDDAASEANWRVEAGYGRLVATSLPAVPLRLGTPVTAIDLTGRGVRLVTPGGDIAARAVILTVSTAVLASGAITGPAALDGHAHAAACLPLGLADKIFLHIERPDVFESETSLIGDPHDPGSASYYIRPFGHPVIEGFVGGTGARALEQAGAAASYAFALDQLAGLLGSNIRRLLRPLAATAWGRMDRIGGSYSHALPGHAAARATLAHPIDNRLFFAGEATHATDFSTCHGALASGTRAAAEARAVLDGRGLS